MKWWEATILLVVVWYLAKQYEYDRIMANTPGARAAANTIGPVNQPVIQTIGSDGVIAVVQPQQIIKTTPILKM